jgi:hypothetical protein
MSYSHFDDFAAAYAGPIPNNEIGNGNYFGFDLAAGSSDRYHVHCKTFIVKNKDEIWLYDVKKHIITISKTNNVLGVDSCKSNYWDVNCKLFLRDSNV